MKRRVFNAVMAAAWTMVATVFSMGAFADVVMGAPSRAATASTLALGCTLLAVSRFSRLVGDDA